MADERRCLCKKKLLDEVQGGRCKSFQFEDTTSEYIRGLTDNIYWKGTIGTKGIDARRHQMLKSLPVVKR